MEYDQSAPMGMTDQRNRLGSKVMAWLAAMLAGIARCMARPSALASGLSTTSQCIRSTKIMSAKAARSPGGRNSAEQIRVPQYASRRQTPRQSHATGIASNTAQNAG